jgi:hypothetical protein
METAKVRMPGCAISLPFETAYDQDVVFDHLQSVAHAHYRAALEVHERCLLVSECGTQACGCADCGRTIACGSVQHRADDHTLCTGCARRMLHALDRSVGSTPALHVVTGAERPPPAP